MRDLNYADFITMMRALDYSLAQMLDSNIYVMSDRDDDADGYIQDENVRTAAALLLELRHKLCIVDDGSINHNNSWRFDNACLEDIITNGVNYGA